MYRKFEFSVKPVLDEEDRPNVVHPYFNLTYSGVMEIDWVGERVVKQLYINGIEERLHPTLFDYSNTSDWRRFRTWLHNKVVKCDDSDEAQAKITLPPGNLYDETYKKKPASNSRWFDATELTAGSAAEFAAIIGEVEQVGETLVTEFSHQKIN